MGVGWHEARPEEAARGLAEAERLAARSGVHEVQVRAWFRMGLHAVRCGFQSRAMQWWRKALLLVHEVQGQIEAEADREAFERKADHRRVVEELWSAVAGRAARLGEAGAARASDGVVIGRKKG